MLLFAFLLWLGSLAAPDAGVRTCVVVAPLDGGAETAAGGAECDRRTLPASTFKVPHALIALDTGVITPASVMTWDGTAQDYKTWERDQTLDSAIKFSVVWFFQRAARAIGRERELEHLRAFEYGSRTFDGAVDAFWLNGQLTISPREQVAFLRRMFRYELRIDRRHVDAVKAALTMPAGKLSNATGVHDFPLGWPGAVLRLKTGNGTVNGDRVSWLVGEVESGGRAYVFAGRARSSTGALETTAGADAALRVLNAMTP